MGKGEGVGADSHSTDGNRRLRRKRGLGETEGRARREITQHGALGKDTRGAV